MHGEHLVMNVGFRVFDPVRAAITAVDYNQVFRVKNNIKPLKILRTL
jgi:hypothetical protein